MLSGPSELGLRQKVTLWVAQRLYITAIWVKTGRVVKRLVCSVIGVDIRALDWLDLEGQIFHMSEGDHIGEPDYSIVFINQVIFCAIFCIKHLHTWMRFWHLIKCTYFMKECILEQCFGGNLRYTGGQGSHLNIKGTFRLLEPWHWALS